MCEADYFCEANNFWNYAGGGCGTCEANNFCVGGVTQAACPDFSVSSPQSESIGDCKPYTHPNPLTLNPEP